MAEGDYVEPLSGEEIVIDLCSLIAEKLRNDCNLRDSDAYTGGYSAEVSIKLRAYGMDVAEVNVEVATNQVKDKSAVPDEVADFTLEVPVETALDQVRERSDQPVPTLANIGGQEEIRPRRYVRRAGGGATGDNV